MSKKLRLLKGSSGICLICGKVATKVLTYEADSSKVNEIYCDSCFQKGKVLNMINKLKPTSTF
jgi:hypothetical protein